MGSLKTLAVFLLLEIGFAAASDPSMNVHIAPILGAVGNGSSSSPSDVKYLNTTLSITNPQAKASSPFLRFFVGDPNLTEDQKYSSSGKHPLTAWDPETGKSIPLSYTDDPKTGDRTWVLDDEDLDTTANVINVNFVAEPRGEISGVSGRSDLRYDQGGAFGQGGRFIPLPPEERSWEFSVSWTMPPESEEDSEDESNIIRYASSFGDEDKSRSWSGFPSEVLATTCFAVGRGLQRWPAWGEDTTMVFPPPKLGGRGRKEEDASSSPSSSSSKSTTNGSFGFYWIGSLPWDSSDTASVTRDLYQGHANFFSDHDSDFSVFVRRDFEAYGGVGGFKSFLLEYNSESAEENPQPRIENLLSHEIVHNFMLTYPYVEFDKWYVEGGAQYLLSIGPYLGGTLDRKTFIRWLNDNAQDYYTASPITDSWKSLVTDYWSGGTPAVKAPYTRGFMYLAYAQGLIQKATSGENSLVDVILELYHRYLDGETVQTEQFLQVLGGYLGDEDEARLSFARMANGTMLVPDEDAFAGYGLKMVRRDQPAWQVGFSESSLGEGKVMDLVPGSNAEKAGLVEGDKIVGSWSFWSASDMADSMFQVTIEREDGRQEVVEWWPRAENTTKPTWLWVDVDEL